MELYTHMMIGFCVIIYLESRYGENGRFTSRNDAYSERRFFAFYVYIYTYSAKTQVLQGCSFLKADSTKQGGAKTLRGSIFPFKT